MASASGFQKSDLFAEAFQELDKAHIYFTNAYTNTLTMLLHLSNTKEKLEKQLQLEQINHKNEINDLQDQAFNQFQQLNNENQTLRDNNAKLRGQIISLLRLRSVTPRRRCFSE